MNLLLSFDNWKEIFLAFFRSATALNPIIEHSKISRTDWLFCLCCTVLVKVINEELLLFFLF